MRNNATRRMNIPNAHANHEDIVKQINVFFDHFGLRRLVVPKPFQTKNGNSIVADVLNRVWTWAQVRDIVHRTTTKHGLNGFRMFLLNGQSLEKRNAIDDYTR